MNFLDLFAGIGGFRLGMEQAGHECVGYVEWDKFARKSYEAIHDTEGEWTAHDITTVTDDDIRQLRNRGQIDVICGGFPCQAFSVAGNRKGFDDTRGTLFFEIARIANIIRPRYLFLENVKGLLNHAGGDTFETILRTLDELGYDAEWDVLNSKNYGVPQNRERVFIIGHLRGESTQKVFPIARTDGQDSLPVKIVAHRNGYRRNTQTFSPEGITEALDTGQGGGRGHYTVISVGNVNPSGKGMNGQVYSSEGLSPTLTTNKGEGTKIVEYNRKKGLGKELNVAHALNSSDWRGLNRNQNQNAVAVPIKEAAKQGFDFALPGDSVNYSLPSSKTRRGRVGKGIANTLDTGCQQGVLTEEYRIRKLTPLECWRLQGFPDWAFDKAQAVNSDSQLYKQAGNSVTVNVIHEIAKRLNL